MAACKGSCSDRWLMQLRLFMQGASLFPFAVWRVYVPLRDHSSLGKSHYTTCLVSLMYYVLYVFIYTSANWWYIMITFLAIHLVISVCFWPLDTMLASVAQKRPPPLHVFPSYNKHEGQLKVGAAKQTRLAHMFASYSEYGGQPREQRH